MIFQVDFLCQCQQIPALFQSFVKLRIEILFLVIWFNVESVNYKKIQISDQI